MLIIPSDQQNFICTDAILRDILKKDSNQLASQKKQAQSSEQAALVRFEIRLEILNDRLWEEFVKERRDLLKLVDSNIIFILDESLLHLLNDESKSIIAAYVCSEEDLQVLLPVYEFIFGIGSSENEPMYGKLIKHYFQTHETLRFVEWENKWYFLVELCISMRYVTGFSIENLKMFQKRTRSGKSLISELMHYVFPSTLEIQDTINPSLFYDNVCGLQESGISSFTSPDKLNTDLLPFQKKAVEWMLKREKCIPNTLDCHKENIPPTWEASVDVDGKQIYYNKVYGIICSSIIDVKNTFTDIDGGILAEEMGLGKTVEIIALILKNERKTISGSKKIFDSYTESYVIEAKTTLIITPISILQQWISEFSKLAPHLKILHYVGLKNSSSNFSTEDLIEYDVIITSYNTLRSLRYGKKYISKLSPLVQIQFWRVCLDEAQMIETGVSNASLAALSIPRVHAWCITGTPVRNSLSDLYGLLLFLRFYPFNCNKIWKRLVDDPRNASAFVSLFKLITCRHTKKYIGDEVILPKQERTILLLDFTPIEEHNYLFLLKQALQEIGFNDQKSPASIDWNFDDFKDKMRHWLLRLRQTCCQMQVGTINKMNLGGQLIMLSEALDVMLKKVNDTIDNDERSLYTLKFTIGRLYESKSKPQEALDIWLPILKIVQDKMELFEQELGKAKQHSLINSKNEIKNAIDTIDENSSTNYYNTEEKKAPIKSVQTHIRHWRSLAHRLAFFIATAYYQSGNKEKEDEYYSKAEQIRREILSETESRALFLMKKLSQRVENDEFSPIPKLNLSEIINNVHLSHNKSLLVIIKKLNNQAERINEWRQKIIDLSLCALVDHNENVTGEEYIKSLDIMEDAYQYLEALQSAIASRIETLKKSFLTIVETQSRLSSQQTQLKHQLTSITEKLRPTSSLSLKSIIDDLHISKQINETDTEGKKYRKIQNISNFETYHLSEILKNEIKITTKLEKEISDLSHLHNARIEYYRQLQIISDSVAELDEELLEPQNYVKKMKELEEKIKSYELTIYSNQGRLRYLKYLSKTSSNESEIDKICVICQNIFDFGILTECGHIFCKFCMMQWLTEHQTCPSCKTEIKETDYYNIVHNNSKTNNIPKDSNIYSLNHQVSQKKFDEINKMFLEIKSIKLKESYGVKVDMIVKHILWMRKGDSIGPKSVIFSQWKEILDTIITKSKKKGNIENDPVARFKNDNSIEVFMLHARSQSAGLTLTNATNVFLCEPLVNIAIELQAISRIHRIGQNKQTFVWLYIIRGTIEEKIVKLTEKKREQFAKIYNNTSKNLYNNSNLNDLSEKELQKNINKLTNITGEIIENNALLYLWGEP
ncbi:hypothetical protein MERGE_000536 [Pneumocystis wakefieldiae]|uniref:RING-type domain-containing protein n=1 Tax=Pneumocystis wakefieldiae TaxID=38082 RepID=A0A899FWJ3_9ASCO|nr:hypothetical protein MERGE_000536 [Pneumocystis wakefieldiae]